MCLVIKFKPAVPEYKEIQIVLDSTPVVEQPVEEQSAVAEQESVVAEPVEAPELPNPVEKPVAEAKVESPKAQPSAVKPKAASQPKTQTNTTKTDPSKKVDFDNMQYSTDMETAINNQFNNKTSKTQFRDDLFSDDDNSYQENTPQTNIKVNEKSGAFGEAALKSDDKSIGAKGSERKDNSDVQSPSDDTQKALKNIANATPYSKSIGNIESTVMAQTTKKQGYVNMSLSDGSTRALLEPLTPSIELSPDAAKAIENTITVRIKFYVSKDGNVQSGKISILYQNSDNSAESLLPPIVRNEIFDQLRTWLFEPGNTEAYAIFELTIKRK